MHQRISLDKLFCDSTQKRKKRDLDTELTKITHADLVGVDRQGESVTIPRGNTIAFQGDLRDWRNVRVQWAEQSLTISRGAWDACVPIICGR